MAMPFDGEELRSCASDSSVSTSDYGVFSHQSGSRMSIMHAKR